MQHQPAEEQSRLFLVLHWRFKTWHKEKTQRCLFRQTKTQPMLATGCSACLGVSWVITLAAECDNPNHSVAGEAGERLCAGMTLADGYNFVCRSSLSWRWTHWHLNMESSGSWSTSSNTRAAMLFYPCENLMGPKIVVLTQSDCLGWR